MQSRFLNYRSSIIHYRFGGQGVQPLVCFHGYGESAASFDFLEKKLGASHCIIAIDLPFHGQTQWKEVDLDAGMLAEITLSLLEDVNADAHNIQLAGFSMGGRMALCVLQQIPERISTVVLMAPDGLTVNFWYWLSTQTVVGNSLFRLTMRKPGWFMGMLRASNKLRIINQSIYKFVEHYIHDNTVRQQLYERWTGLRNCTPSMKKIQELIPKHGISVRLLNGKYVRIISHERGNKLFSHIAGCSVAVIDCGHQVLHPKNAAAISNALLP